MHRNILKIGAQKVENAKNRKYDKKGNFSNNSGTSGEIFVNFDTLIVEANGNNFEKGQLNRVRLR